MVAIPLVFNSGLTNTYAGPTNSDPGVGGATSAESGPGLEQTINIWDLDLASLACPLSELESITVEGIYTKSAGLDTVRDGGLVWLGDITTFTPWGTISAPQGDLNPPATNLPGSVTRDVTLAGGTVASSGDPIGGTWSDPTPPTVLHLVVLADANGTNADGETVSVSLPTVTATFAPGSACAAVVPNTVDDTATTPVNVPVTVSVGTNDDPSPCAPGCMVHRQPTTNFIDPASTATGITASVDVAGVATVEASGPGTAIIHVESGCSPSCDANGGDVTAWTTQTLTVTVTPAVVPGACVEIGPVFDPAKTAAFAATLGMEQGTATEVNATAGVGTEWAVGVYTVTIPVGCENDIESITAQSTINASGGVNALNDGALLAVTDDYSTLTPWGTVAPTAGTESVLTPGFLWTGFGGQGGPTPIGNLLEGAWSAGPLPKTEFDLVVITDARAADTPDGEYVIAEAPKVCVTYAEGSPCAPTPLPCVEVPVTFSQADTDAIGAAFGIDPTTDPTSVEADADVGGKQTIGVWLIELPEGCDAEVVSVQAAATVDISATMDPDDDGAFIAVVDSIVPPTGWGTLAPTTGDPNLQIPGSLSTGYTSSGGTAWPAGPSTVTLDGVWTGGTLPASTLALLVYADALGTSPSGSNIRVNVPETVCVTFANPCGPTPPPPSIPYCFDLRLANEPGCWPLG